MAKGKDWKVTERVGMVSWFGGNQGSRVVENWRLTKKRPTNGPLCIFFIFFI